MPFCASCGSQVEGRFCAKCGAPVGEGPGPATPPPQAPPGAAVYPPPVPPASAAAMTDNAASALCYALRLITGVLVLLIAPYNQNGTVRFHAFQSIFLTVAVLIIAIAVGIVESILGGVLGWWFVGIVSF